MLIEKLIICFRIFREELSPVCIHNYWITVEMDLEIVDRPIWLKIIKI